MDGRASPGRRIFSAGTWGKSRWSVRLARCGEWLSRKRRRLAFAAIDGRREFSGSR